MTTTLRRAVRRAVVLAGILVVLTRAPIGAQDPTSNPLRLVAVETGVAGIIGVVPDDATPRGGGRPAPAGRPVEIRSPDEFAARFLDFTPLPSGWSSRESEAVRHLQLAVHGFFANGGRRAWVLRVPRSTDLDDPGPALRALGAVDVDLVLVPGATGRRQHDAILAHVALMGDRFALLDGRPEPRRRRPGDVRATPRNSDRATVVFPWLAVANPVRGERVSQPPSGHVAGVMARNDRERGVHRAPANLLLAAGERPEAALSSAEIETLTLDGILVLRPASASPGSVTWGGRTLGGDANGTFRYLAVRRTVDRVAETLRRGITARSCPDALPPVEAFVRELWEAGALQGARPTEAFFVRCRPGSDVLDLGLALIRSGEFITLAVPLGSR